MTRKARRLLFYALVAVFLVLGAGIVLYAQGWRFDFATGRVDKVGAIFVRAFPADASISLNGKPAQSQVGFLSRGTLISDLFPKNYKLKLSKNGYDGWQENVSVAPSLVTELKYAVLVPQNATSVAPGTIPGILALESSTARIAGETLAAYAIKLAKGDLMVGSATLANDVRDFSVTSDGSMIAALEHRSIEIFSLNDASGYYRFNLPDVAGIARLIWYKDRTHLFVVYKNSISFLDFDDAGLANFTTVAQGLPAIVSAAAGTLPFYNPQTNALYVLGPNRQWLRYDFPE